MSTDFSRFIKTCISSVATIIPTYGFIIVGCLLALINLPVFGIVIWHRTLRINYIILSLIFLHNGLTGFTSVIYGVKAWTYDPALDDRYDSNKECLYQV
ncbi:unnamed protein product [Gongylonema pulchrum]|uniref:G_PROTEIN_RECEP_F1_2 domain-containing protein n=1 Tax=Gongylonema pulchrum TaxID=637853 RepID=A0A183CX57_9BILA|nr:unnamed protein product [Gongylonema pulchrum]